MACVCLYERHLITPLSGSKGGIPPPPPLSTIRYPPPSLLPVGARTRILWTKGGAEATGERGTYSFGPPPPLGRLVLGGGGECPGGAVTRAHTLPGWGGGGGVRFRIRRRSQKKGEKERRRRGGGLGVCSTFWRRDGRHDGWVRGGGKGEFDFFSSVFLILFLLFSWGRRVVLGGGGGKREMLVGTEGGGKGLGERKPEGDRIHLKKKRKTEKKDEGAEQSRGGGSNGGCHFKS